MLILLVVMFLFGFLTPEAVSPSRCLLENVSPYQPGLYVITPHIPSEQNSKHRTHHQENVV